LRTVHPLNAYRQSQRRAWCPRHYVNYCVCGVLVIRRPILEAEMEAFHFQRRFNSLSDLAYHVPNHVLLLDIQIVERSHMTARSDYYVTSG
jgi:hypothetical protein